MNNDSISSPQGSALALLFTPDTKKELKDAVDLWCEKTK